MKTISGPKLQTFYTCKDALHTCKYLYETYDQDTALFDAKCERLLFTIDEPYLHKADTIKTPIDCPLLGKTQEEDMNFDKDVLMRNL